MVLMNAPPPVAASANSRGVAALQTGRFEEAVRAFREAVAADPGAGALHRNLASALRALGRDEEECQSLDEAIRLDRRDMVAWLRKAELHQRRGDKGEALAAWSAALQLAEPLRPWEGPLAQALSGGERFRDEALATIRAEARAALAGPMAELDAIERRRVEALIAHATGASRLYVNQCAGLYYPFLPMDEFFDDCHFPWFDRVAAATAEVRAELEALLVDPGEALRPYVRMGEGIAQNKWTALDNKLDWGACFLWEYGEPNRAVLDRCPATAALLGSIPDIQDIDGRSPSAFFSMLRPKTVIPAHTGVTNTRAIVHLPLIVPEGCAFRVGNEVRPWVEGKPFAFDDTIEHEAWNNSDELRAVLIFDVWNPHLSINEREMIRRYFQTADRTGYKPVTRD